MLFSLNALDNLPLCFYTSKHIISENSMSIPVKCKYWDEVHNYECEWYLDCLKSKTLHSKLKLCNRPEPTSVPFRVKKKITIYVAHKMND